MGCYILRLKNVYIDDGFIKGLWLNNNPFSMNTRGEIPLDNLRLVPEPMTASIMLFGILGIIIRGKR